MENYKIYALKLKDYDNIRYIGLTKQILNNRLNSHKSVTSKRKNKNGYWVKKHKNEIEIILIEENIECLEYANEREIYWIKYYTELGIDLTNSTIGGDGVQSPCVETIKRMSESAKGRKHSDETKKLISEILRDREPISDETREKLSNSSKGRKLTEETKEKLRIINTGKKLTDSAKEERKLKMGVYEPPNKGIPMSVEQRIKLSEIKIGKPNGKSKPLEVFNKNGEFVNSYSSPIECSIDMGLNRKQMYDVLNGRRKTYKGYIFKYIIK